MTHKHTSFFFGLVYLSGSLYGQPWSGILDPTRAMDWSNAGADPRIINETRTQCVTAECDTVVSKAESATLAEIDAAIRSAPQHTFVYLPAGTYGPYNSNVNMVGVNYISLRGAGPMATKLRFSGTGATNLIYRGTALLVANDANGMDSTNVQNSANWTAGYAQGSTTITLDTVTNLKVGSVIILDQLDDGSADPGQDIYVCGTVNKACSSQGNTEQSGRGCGPGQLSCRGQMQEVAIFSCTTSSGTGDTVIGHACTSGANILLREPIAAPNWSPSRSPGAYWTNALFANGIGVENLTIDISPSTSTAGTILACSGTQNFWIKNVRTYNPQRSTAAQKHVQMIACYHTTVMNSYFYGGSGTSDNYGVNVARGSGQTLVMNNIFQHMEVGIQNEGSFGLVGAYNYMIDDWYQSWNVWQQSSYYHHTEGDHLTLWEGNIGDSVSGDNIHGSSWMYTVFRNYFSGRDLYGGAPVGGKTLQTIPVMLMSLNRYYNIVGNIIGTPGYHNQYESYPTALNSNTGVGCTNYNKSIYVLGWSAAGAPSSNCYDLSMYNDLQTRPTLMRWGNWDTVTNDVRWCASNDASFSSQPCSSVSEVPTGLNKYPNPNPSSRTLPASFFLSNRPAWWATPWGTPPWPPIGPDVADGNIPDTGGHANKIPAKLCYEHTPADANYSVGQSGLPVLQFDATTCYTDSITIPLLPPTSLSARTR